MKLVLMDHIAGRSYADVLRAVNFGLGLDEGIISIRTHVDNTKSYLGPVLNAALFRAGGLAAIKSMNLVLFVGLFTTMVAIGRPVFAGRLVLVAASVFAFYAGGHRSVVAGEVEDNLASLLFAFALLLYLRFGRAFVPGLLLGLAFLFKFWIAIFVAVLGIHVLIRRDGRRVLLMVAGGLLPIGAISITDGGATIQSVLMTVDRQAGYSSWSLLASRLITTGMLPVVLAAAWVLVRRPVIRKGEVGQNASPTDDARRQLPYASLFFWLTGGYLVYVVAFRDAHAVTFVMMLCLVTASYLVAAFLLDSPWFGSGAVGRLALVAVVTAYGAGNLAVAWRHLYRDTRPFTVTPGRDAKRLPRAGESSTNVSEKERQRLAQSPAPGRLVMQTHLVFDPHQVPSASVALVDEEVAHLARVGQRAFALLHAHIQVDATAHMPGRLHEAEDVAVREPEGWTHDANEPVPGRLPKKRVEADQAAQR